MSASFTLQDANRRKLFFRDSMAILAQKTHPCVLKSLQNSFLLFAHSIPHFVFRDINHDK